MKDLIKYNIHDNVHPDKEGRVYLADLIAFLGGASTEVSYQNSRRVGETDYLRGQADGLSDLAKRLKAYLYAKGQL